MPFNLLEQSSQFHQVAEEAGLAAPEIGATERLESVLGAQGRRLAIDEASLLAGLKAYASVSPARIIFDELHVPYIGPPQVRPYWPSTLSPEITVGVSTRWSDQERGKWMDEKLSAALWLGVRIGELVGSGEVRQLSQERSDRMRRFSKKIFTTMAIAGNAISIPLLARYGIIETGAVASAICVSADMVTADLEDRYIQSPSTNYIVSRLASESVLFATDYTPVHLGGMMRQTALGK